VADFIVKNGMKLGMKFGVNSGDGTALKSVTILPKML